jgi:hypothetical protein
MKGTEAMVVHICIPTALVSFYLQNAVEGFDASPVACISFRERRIIAFVVVLTAIIIILFAR